MLGVVFLYGDRGSDGIHGRRKPDVRRGVAGASSGADAEDAIDCYMLVRAGFGQEGVPEWRSGERERDMDMDMDMDMGIRSDIPFHLA
jgi:hypothetical protein